MLHSKMEKAYSSTLFSVPLSLPSHWPIQKALTITLPGTAIIAQAGIWIVRRPPLLPEIPTLLTNFQLTATVWASAFIAPLSLFSAHPVRLPYYIRRVDPH